MGRKENEQVIATSAREKLVYQTIRDVASIGPSATKTYAFTLLPNCIYEIVGFSALINSCAPDVGDHSIEVGFNIKAPALNTYPRIIYGNQAHNQQIILDTDWVSTMKTARPALDPVSNFKGIRFDSVNALRIVYYNGTNIAQTNVREFAIVMIEKQIVG